MAVLLMFCVCHLSLSFHATGNNLLDKGHDSRIISGKWLTNDFIFYLFLRTSYLGDVVAMSKRREPRANDG